MTKQAVLVIMLMLLCSTAFAVTAVEGRIEKMDRTAKTIVVRAADGTEHTFHLVTQTAIHGGSAMTQNSFHGLKAGSEVVVHYTTQGADETAEEIDHVGQDGLNTAQGTITHLDRSARTVTIKTADGTQQVYHLTDHAVQDAGKDIPAGAERSAKVTVYYTQRAGRKIAHFFTKSL